MPNVSLEITIFNFVSIEIIWTNYSFCKTLIKFNCHRLMPPTMNDSVDKLINKLEDQSIESEPESQVSFAGKGLKLNTSEDASTIVSAIRDCPNLKSLNLEGNTVGVDAAEAISEALATKGQLSQAILKDIFTGRLKTEVPPAVRSLMTGISLSSARLVELDLSDNAFGPIGMEALAPFLESEACENLKILRLNNNGLGIGGGKLLGRALNNLTKLEVFICGRNRLENPGAKEIGASLANLEHLSHLEMPQNGINFEGIEALSKAIKGNLKILNLNDNTMTVEGGKIMAEALRRSRPKLESINFADCLLIKEGFTFVLNALKETGLFKSLKKLDVSGNEISGDDVVDLIVNTFGDVSEDFNSFTLNLSANNFGELNCQLLQDELGDKLELILEDDEGADDDQDGEEEEEEEEEEQDEYEHPEDYLEDAVDTGYPGSNEISTKIKEIIEDEETTLDKLCEAFVNLSTEAFDTTIVNLPGDVLKDTDALVKAIIEKNPSYESAQALLSHMGLIKSEEGYHKKSRDLRGPFLALSHSVGHLKKAQKDVFQLFLGRPNEIADRTGKIKHKFLQVLFS